MTYTRSMTNGPDPAPAEDERTVGERDSDWLRLAQGRAAENTTQPATPESPAELRKRLRFMRLRPWQTPH